MKLELRAIVKRFGDVTACDGASLTVGEGEVVALLGENGAGKSTLMKVAYGVLAPDGGELVVDGQSVRVGSPRAAQELGLGMVFQQWSLIPALSVVENLLLGLEGVPFFLPAARARRRAVLETVEALCPGLDPSRRVATLGVAEKQLVELAKLLVRGSRLLILDEPTSVLAEPEAKRLWQRIRELKAQGRSVVLVTHKLADVEACADRVVIMRAGRVVAETHDVGNRTAILEAVLGEAPATPERPARLPGGPALSVAAVCVAEAGQALEELSFEVAAGEVLGVAGVAGNGQELLGRVLTALVAPHSGSVRLGGRALADPSDPRIGYVPEQPRDNGTAARLSTAENLNALALAQSPFWGSPSAGRRAARSLLERFDVRPPDPERAAGTLSGGNLQKLVLARELGVPRTLVVACFPAMGLDAGASARVVHELDAQARGGAAVVWIGEDLDALLAHADRVAVLHRGRMRGPVPVGAVSKAELGAWMTGAAA